MLNKSPALAVKDMTREEAWSGVKPMLIIFGFLDALAIFMCQIVREINWMIRVFSVCC